MAAERPARQVAVSSLSPGKLIDKTVEIHHLLFGVGVAKDLVKARNLYRELKNLQKKWLYLPNDEEFAKLVNIANSPEMEGFAALEKSCNTHKNPYIQNYVGLLYRMDEHVAKYLPAAFRYYKLAADQGHADAQFHLGFLYENGGEGVAKDLPAAFRYYKLAADQGHAAAQSNLGFLYKNGGEGVAKNLPDALRYFKLAADQGLAYAQNNLGFLYKNGGEGVAKNLPDALRYFKLAADQGHAAAQFNLGFLYENGEGVEENPAKAKKWYVKAALTGSEKAFDIILSDITPGFLNTNKMEEINGWVVAIRSLEESPSEVLRDIRNTKGETLLMALAKAKPDATKTIAYLAQVGGPELVYAKTPDGKDIFAMLSKELKQEKTVDGRTITTAIGSAQPLPGREKTIQAIQNGLKAHTKQPNPDLEVKHYDDTGPAGQPARRSEAWASGASQPLLDRRGGYGSSDGRGI